MGLDIFLLVMDVEEHFGVRLNDERADGINTVGELYTFLLGQTRRSAPTPCPTARASSLAPTASSARRPAKTWISSCPSISERSSAPRCRY